MDLDPYLTTYTKINSRWIVGPNVNNKTIKHLGANVAYLPDAAIGKAFLKRKHKEHLSMKAKTAKPANITAKDFGSSENTLMRAKA